MIKNSGSKVGASTGENVIVDSVNGETYRFIIEAGKLALQSVTPVSGVSRKTEVGPVYDTETGIAYNLVVDNGVLAIKPA